MRGDERPEVTAVIPTHNRWDLVCDAVESVLGQEDVRLEVVVVDDGSAEPQTPPALEDPRVRILRHDSSKGVAEARNAGMREARGEWVAFLDDDDVWAPTYLRTLLEVARAADAVYAYTGVVEVNDRFELHRIPVTPEPEELPALLLRHNAVPAAASNTFVRTELMRRLGGFDPELRVLEDWELWIRLSQSGPGAMSPELLVGHRLHLGSVQISSVEKLIPAFDYIAAKHRDTARSHGIGPHGLAFSRYVAHYQWRGGRRLGAARVLIRGFFRYGGMRALLRAGRALARGDVARAREKAAALPTQEPPWIAAYR